MLKIINKKIYSILIFVVLFLNLFVIFTSNVSAAGYINVTSPSYGTYYYEGETIYISWYSYDVDGNVRIEIRRTGYTYTIASNTTNDGYHSFYIPEGFASSYQYKIRIQSISDSNIYDDSSGFYIQDASITVTEPDSGDVWYPGEYQTIRWSSENAGTYVKIQYKTGSRYSTITTNYYNYGTYSWNIPLSHWWIHCLVGFR